jgi:hypothetical protein
MISRDVNEENLNIVQRRHMQSACERTSAVADHQSMDFANGDGDFVNRISSFCQSSRWWGGNRVSDDRLVWVVFRIHVKHTMTKMNRRWLRSVTHTPADADRQ